MYDTMKSRARNMGGRIVFFGLATSPKNKKDFNKINMPFWIIVGIWDWPQSKMMTVWGKLGGWMASEQHPQYHTPHQMCPDQSDKSYRFFVCFGNSFNWLIFDLKTMYNTRQQVHDAKCKGSGAGSDSYSFGFFSTQGILNWDDKANIRQIIWNNKQLQIWN